MILVSTADRRMIYSNQMDLKKEVEEKKIEKNTRRANQDPADIIKELMKPIHQLA